MKNNKTLPTVAMVTVAIATVETKKIMFAALVATLVITLASVSYADSVSAVKGCFHNENPNGHGNDNKASTCGDDTDPPGDYDPDPDPDPPGEDDD